MSLLSNLYYHQDYNSIPLFATYEIRISGHEIVIGPYIGILVHKKEETLDRNISVYSNYLYDYQSIGGVILAFSVEGIQMKSEQLSGFVFNPQTGTWVKGVYPYPAAVFKRVGIKKSMRNHMHKVIGDAIFNEYILDKWETYDWLRNFPEIKPHLPDSKVYCNTDDLKVYLNLYDKVYLNGMIRYEYGKHLRGLLYGYCHYFSISRNTCSVRFNTLYKK